jgi:hypothetical protein
MRISILSMIFVLTVAGVAAAQSDAERARIELEKGYALRKEGRFAEALPLLVDSYKLAPQLKTLINLADCEENLGKLADALEHWTAARDEATSQGDASIAKVAGERAEKLDKRTPTITLQLAADAPASAVVSWDGTVVPAKDLGAKRRVDPGAHVAMVQVPGYPPRRYELQLSEGDVRVMQLSPASAAVETSTASDVATPEKSSSSTPWRTIGWTAIGVGAASVAVGTFFGIEAISKKSDANCPSNHCAGGGDPDALRTAVKDGNLSTVFFVAGGVLAAGGVALIVLTPKGESSSASSTTGSSLHATVSLLPNGVSLQGAW